MTGKLVWGKPADVIYETGVEKGVLYLDGKAYAWNGLTSVDEAPAGAEPNKKYADNGQYITLMSAETYGLTINAYTYPKEFGVCNGEKELAPGVAIGQQIRKGFAFSYETLIGNAEEQTDYGSKIHIVYGCLASPSATTRETVNDTPEAAIMSWEVSTTPVQVKNAKATATVVVDSTKVTEGSFKKIQDALYGTDTEAARLLLPDEILALIQAAG